MPRRAAACLSVLLAGLACPAWAQDALPGTAAPVAQPVKEDTAPDEAPPPVAQPVEEEKPIIIQAESNIPRPAPVDRALSRSGMFRVSGGDSAQRGSVALILEQTKDNFEGMLRDISANPTEKKDTLRAEPKGRMEPFKVPVDVILEGKQGDPVPPRNVVHQVVVTPNAFLLVIRIHLARGIDNEMLERAALTVLLYERSLGDLKPEEAYADKSDDGPLPLLHPWLVEGLMEAEKWRTNRADRRIYEGVFRKGGGFTPDEVFDLSEYHYRQLDSASKLSFRSLSGALVMALLEQPEGRGAFRSFCNEAARFSGETPVLLRKHFPQLNLSGNSLSKWWHLKLAQMVQPTLTEVLPVMATDAALEEALQFHVHDATGNPVNKGISAWKEISELKEQERAEAVRMADEALIRLSYRCFPSYRALLTEYQAILRDVVGGKDKGKIDQRLTELAEQRKLRTQRAARASDFLDFVEIKDARNLSGEFEDYMRLKEELELRPRPQKIDRMTQVLDKMDKAYEPRHKR